MAIRGGYAPPGVYTESVFESPTVTAGVVGRVPLLIGSGKETFSVEGVSLVRGSSSTVDQNMVEEDATGRAVFGQNPDNSYIIGDFDGSSQQVRSRHFPLVTGDGTGTTTRSSASVTATVNGNVVVVLAVDGENGIVTLSESPSLGDDVRISYFFNRTDTFVGEEDLSTQVSPLNSDIFGSQGDMEITSNSRTLVMTVDGSPFSVTLPVKHTNTSREDHIDILLARFDAQTLGSLVVTSYLDAEGVKNLKFSAKGSILIGNGDSNSALGLIEGQTGTSRNSVFYTQNTPIVDGSNGGVVTTDISNVAVLVDGVSVVPTSVDGTSGAIELSFSPLVGSTISVSYSHNTFRDSFDYVPSRDVVSLDLVSLVPNGGGASSNFLEGADWVLRDDKIYWGTQALASAGEGQLGNTSFGSSQVNPVLRDERAFLMECSSVVDTSVIPSRTSTISFKLPHLATDGSGSGLATSNPNLISARVGVSLADALDKQPAKVVRVNPADSTIVLDTPVPVGQKVFATFYYNNIQDEMKINGEGYTLSVSSVGGSNQGTYTISNSGKKLFVPSFTGKGTDLTTTFLSFPSGSEAISDARIESGKPVEETVTVQIESFEPTPAIFTTHGSAPYSIVDAQSDTISLDLGTSADKSKTVDLSNPTGLTNKGFFTTLVSEALPYTASSDNAHLGELSGSLELNIDGVEIASAFLAVADAKASDIATVLNASSASTSAKYHCMSPIGNLTVVAGSYDELTLNYQGDTVQESLTITIPVKAGDGLYTPDELATAIEGEITFVGPALGATVECAVENGRLVFTLTTVAGGDVAYGYIEFVANAVATKDFASIAGIDTDVAVSGTQTKWGILPIAEAISTALDSDGTNTKKDRLVLRNRTLIGDNYFPPVDLGVVVVGGDILPKLGLSLGSVKAERQAVVESASVSLRPSWAGLQVDTDVAVKFYNGDGDFPANNVLRLNVSGVSQEITFVGSAGGTLTSINGDVFTALNVNGLANVSVLREGINLRIVDTLETVDSFIEVLDGSANALFGLSEGETSTSRFVSASAVSSALNNNYGDATAVAWAMLDGVEADMFRKHGISYTTSTESGSEFVTFECLTAGVSSVIDFTGTGNAVSTVGNGLKITTADGAVGEAAIQGFFVKSSVSNGSGSANTSTLNDGVGVDGVIGQTYVDSVTGFTFTLLPRDGDQPYPSGANATMTFNVSKTMTANANVPANVVPGVQLFVSNTLGTAVGDTAIVETFNKGGEEPSVGTLYYMNLVRKKSVFGTSVFTRLSDVVSAFGDVGAENPLSLGAYLAFLNGANAVALHQVPLEDGATSLTSLQVANALVDVEGDIVQNQIQANIIVPLVPADEILLSEISKHCDVQSSLRFRSERTAILGMSAGTTPEQASHLASVTRNARVRLVYPDILSLTFTNTQGVSQSLIVDGRYLAVAVACATTSSTIDSATPWTNRLVVGFDSLLRTLDAVDANLVANSGVSVLVPSGNNLKIRHGLTTDISSVLRKTPTVVQIADDVQLRARTLLESYIGQKYLSSVLGQIEGRVNMLFKDLVKEQIIDSYTGLSVVRDPEDPTGLLVEVYYKPVFPLLYIQFTFNIRSSI
jgi:hypothetical protein